MTFAARIRPRITLVALAAGIAAAGCRGAERAVGSLPRQPSSPVVAAIGIDPPAPMLVPGEQVTMTAAAKDSAGTTLPDVAISWLGGDPRIVTLSSAGVLTAIAPGTTTIVAVADNVIAIAVVTIQVPPVVSVAVAPADPTMIPGQHLQFTATPDDQRGRAIAGKTGVWASSNPAVAIVDIGGVVHALAEGTAIVSAASDGKAGAALVTVRAGMQFTSVVTGFSHSCALTPVGAAYCWGDNASGQLGDGTTMSSATPVAVAGGLSFLSLSAGALGTCGLSMSGAAYCWGQRSDLDPSTAGPCSRCSTAPALVAKGIAFASLSVGTNQTCGLTSAGDAYCWGDDTFGALGTVVDSTCSPTTLLCLAPMRVFGGIRFSALSAGNSTTCGVDAAGDAYCWGYNSNTSDFAYSALGVGSASGPETCGVYLDGSITYCSHTPQRVAGGVSFTGIRVSSNMACGLATTGRAFCWGDGSSGALGDGAESPQLLPSIVVSGHTFATAPVGGAEGDHACALGSTGRVYCWGNGSNGALGMGTLSPDCSLGSTACVLSTPQAVVGGLAFNTVSANGRHSCGLATTGFVYCWGANASGQLGNDSNTDSWVPVAVVTKP